VTARLIVNADDYGHSPGVSAGIRQAHRHGVVSTTTAMMNYPDAVPALARAQVECPQLGLGVHLIVTEGRPVLPPEQVPTLIRPDGRFYPISELYAVADAIDPAELKAEWRAQIERFLASGAALDHLDSHHHAACAFEKGMRVFYELAEELDAPVRHPYAVFALFTHNGSLDPVQVDRVRAYADPLMASGRVRAAPGAVTQFYDATVSVETLLDLLDHLEDGATTELMVHPGLVDDEILQGSTYHTMRQTELTVLTDARVLARVRERGIALITFRQL
jgi:predicted glycoside hydrolase/deacetylase ChbG (UPF0249 family)